MIKKIVIIIFISINLYGNYNFSIKSGMNYSTLESNKGLKDYKVGMVFFSSWEERLNDSFYIQIEIGYNLKGYKFEYTKWRSEKIEVGYFNISTIEIPIVLKYKLSDLSIYSGFYKSFIFYENNTSVDYAVDYRKYGTDYGVLIGLEYKYKRILFDFRFQQGFTILNKPNFEEYGPQLESNRQFLFMVGYQMKKKPKVKNNYVLRLNDIKEKR